MRLPLRADTYGVGTVRTFAIAVVLVLFGLGVYFATIGAPPVPPAVPHAIERGDQASVDYIGYFEDGSGVFDTSLGSVAEDNATWPKSIVFTWRPDPSPLGPFLVGNRSVIEGFDDGLLGMVEGQTKTIVVSPELGYGVADPALFVRRPLLQEVPVREQMNESAFRLRFARSPTDGATVIDPFWNWSALVQVSGSVVTVTHSPFVGQSLRPYGAWNARVESIDDTANNGVGVIRVRHLLAASDVGRVLVRDGSRAFAVASLDLAAGEYVADYNFRSVGTGFIWLGKVMVFQVTIVRVIKA